MFWGKKNDPLNFILSFYNLNSPINRIYFIFIKIGYKKIIGKLRKMVLVHGTVRVLKLRAYYSSNSKGQ